MSARKRRVQNCHFVTDSLSNIVNVYAQEKVNMRTRQLTPSSLPPVDIDSSALSQSLAEFLHVESYSYEDRSRMDLAQFQVLHGILERRFPEAHKKLERQVMNEMSLLYRWPGRDETLDPILLMSHLDVVPIEKKEAWERENGTIADGFVWGRGALDVKCGVISIMAAIEHLVASGFTPDRTIYLAFGHDEELGGEEGNGAIARVLAGRGQRLAFVLDEGGAILEGIIPGISRPVAFVAIAEKSPATLKVTAEGDGGHGSIPGKNAIVNLSEAVRRIEANPMPARLTRPVELLFDALGPEMSLTARLVVRNRWLFGKLLCRKLAQARSTAATVRSTMNFTQLHTWSAMNQSPKLAEAIMSVRLLADETPETICAHVKRITGGIKLSSGKPAVSISVERWKNRQLVSPIECVEFERLEQTIHQVFPDVIVAPGLTAVSTDSPWYYGLTDKVYRFIPMRVGPEDVSRIHGVNERIAVENLTEIAMFYTQLIRNTSE